MRAAVVVAAFTLLAVFPRPAPAQQGWTGTVVAVGPPSDSSSVAVDSVGNLTAVWLQGNAITGYEVRASRGATSTGQWQPPVVVAAAGLDAGGLTVAAGDGGGAVAVWTTAGGVHAARFLPATGLWDAKMISASGPTARAPRVAVAPSGDAVVVWYLDGSYRVEAMHFDSEAATWGATVDLSEGVAPDVGTDGAGNAVAVWSAPAQPGRVHAARYAVDTGAWSAPATLIEQGLGAWEVRVAVDGAGNATAAWTQLEAGNFKAVYTARYAAASGAWAAPVLHRYLYSLSDVDGKSMAVNAGGDVALLWSEPWAVLHHRYVAATGAWTSIATVALPPLCSACHTWQRARVLMAALDSGGHTFGTWRLLDGRVQVARFSTAAPSQPAFLNHELLQLGWSPTIAVAPSGSATALWNTGSGVMSSQWLATPKAPTLQEVVPSHGALAIAFAPPETAETAFDPVNYEYSVDDGATWVSRVPASVVSPWLVTGLIPGQPLRLRLRAVNHAGTGAATVPVDATPGPNPGPPTDLQATAIAGRTVTLSWLAPVNSTEPTSYVIEGGSLPGQTLASVPSDSGETRVTLVVPRGVFFVRVRSVANGLRSVPSNEIRIVVDVPEVPSAPSNLLGLVNGSGVALSWTNTFAGGTPTGLRLDVSGALIGSVQLPLSETALFPTVPPGTYTVHLVAVNASGLSQRSNELTLTVPGDCSGVPGPPTRVAASQVGSTVSFTWSPPRTGAAATGYVVLVSGSYVGTFATVDRQIAGTVGPGSYTLRVAAVNPCGASVTSPGHTVVVP